jgi:hypothetical protein
MFPHWIRNANMGLVTGEVARSVICLFDRVSWLPYTLPFPWVGINPPQLPTDVHFQHILTA